GDHRGLFVLGEQSPWGAGPVDLLRAQQRNVWQLVAVHRTAQRGAYPVDDRAVQGPIAGTSADDRRGALGFNGTQPEFDDRPRHVRRCQVCPRTEVVRGGVGDKGRPDTLPRNGRVVAVRRPENGCQTREKGAGDLGSRTDIAPAVVELRRKLRNDLL